MCIEVQVLTKIVYIPKNYINNLLIKTKNSNIYIYLVVKVTQNKCNDALLLV